MKQDNQRRIKDGLKSSITAWFNSDFRVTATGTAPIAVTKWECFAGTNKTLVQATALDRPNYDPSRSEVVCTGNDGNDFFNTSPTFTFNQQNFTICFIGTLQTVRHNFDTHNPQLWSTTGPTADAIIDADTNIGQVTINSVTIGVPVTSPAMHVIVGTAGALKMVINDEIGAAGAALGAGTSTVNSMLGLNAGDASLDFGARDIIVFNRALSDGEILGILWPYAKDRLGISSHNGQLVIEGDSIAYGYLANFNHNSAQRMGTPRSILHRAFVEAGIRASALISTSVTASMFRAGETNVAWFQAGINDINGGTSGAALFTLVDGWRTTVQAAGYKAVASTLFHFPGSTEVDAYNTALKGSSGFDGIIDFTAVSQLSDASNATYFVGDNTHPNDLGHSFMATAVAAIVQPLLGV